MDIRSSLVGLGALVVMVCLFYANKESYYRKELFMWESKYEKTYKGLKKEGVWAAWADVNSWPRWDSDTEFTQMTGLFEPGTQFILKPKGGPKVSIWLTEVKVLHSFTDVTRFPMAKMYDTHEMEETAEGLKIRSIIRVQGPLGWLWKKIVAEGVAAGAPKQIDALAEFVKSNQR